MICIYSITNKINGKVYVGQTDNYAKRYYNHVNNLSKNKHHVESLQDDFNKYGEMAFEFKIIQGCTIEELDVLEQKYIKELNAFEDNGGYNANTGGKSGHQISKRTKDKMSKTTKERFANDIEYYNKIAEHNRLEAKKPEVLERLRKNLEMTDERKIVIAQKLQEWWTEERREIKSQEMIDKYTDLEEREKTAEATKLGMANMSKEQLSRRCICTTPIETLIQMTKERCLTQQKMAEKFDVAVSLAKGIKSGVHWIYEYMEENGIPIEKMPEKSKFRSSVSTEILLQIVKDKDMKMSDLMDKYKISKKILSNVKYDKHWIFDYIKENNIIL